MKVAVPATRSNFKCLRFTNIHSVITIKLYGVHALLILCVFWVKKKKKRFLHTPNKRGQFSLEKMDVLHTRDAFPYKMVKLFYVRLDICCVVVLTPFVCAGTFPAATDICVYSTAEQELF